MISINYWRQLNIFQIIKQRIQLAKEKERNVYALTFNRILDFDFIVILLYTTYRM